jgi:hypothetical protein
MEVVGDEYVCVEIINDDASQTVNARVQFATGSAGPWTDVGGLGLWEIAPLEAKSETHDVKARRFVRVLATADGAGSAPARLTVDRVRSTSFAPVLR